MRGSSALERSLIRGPSLRGKGEGEMLWDGGVMWYAFRFVVSYAIRERSECQKLQRVLFSPELPTLPLKLQHPPTRITP
jgi:hypothetical protein